VRKGVKKFFDFPVFGVQVATLLIEILPQSTPRTQSIKISKSKKGCERFAHSLLFNDTNLACALRLRSKAKLPRPRKKA